MTSHFRRIDIEGMTRFDLAPQPAPQMLWVSIDKLVIDDRYQRPLNASNIAAIKRIAADFRWSRFSPVIVAPVEGGSYALIDGQHRAHAASLVGIETIPAMVALVAPEEQALAFIDINTSSIKVQSNNVYRAALTAGAPWAIACRDAVQAAGCKLMTSNRSQKEKKPGEVYAIDLIKQLVARGCGASVTAGLKALLEYEPNNAANFSNHLLTPWLGACADCKAGDAELIAVLRAKRPWLVIELADQKAKLEQRPKAPARRNAFVSMIRERQADG